MKFPLVIAMLLASTAHADKATYSFMKKTYTFRLKEDVDMGECSYRQGGTISIKENDFWGATSRFQREIPYGYVSPMFVLEGCGTEISKMPVEKFVEIYSAASPEFAAQLKEERAREQARAAKRSKEPLSLNVGDLVAVGVRRGMDQTTKTVNHIISVNGVGRNDIRQCDFLNGKVRVKSAPTPGKGGNYELVLMEKQPGRDGCQKGMLLQFPEQQMKEWFSYRLENAVPIKKDGKCYREVNKSFFACDSRKTEAEFQVRKLQDFCPDLAAMYDLKGISQVPVDKLEDKYTGVDFIANDHRLNLEYVKYCEVKLDPEAEHKACVKEMEVACPAKTRAPEEKFREDTFQQDLMEQPNHPVMEQNFPEQGNGTL